MNDQHPFDVMPDDESGPAAGADRPDTSRRPVFRYSSEDAPSTEGADESEAPADDPGTDHRRRRRIAALCIAAAVIFTAGAGGGAAVSLALAGSSGATSTDDGSGTGTLPQGGTGGAGGTGAQGGAGPQNGFGGGNGGSGGFGSGSGGSAGTGTSTGTGTAATADQIVGLVTIVTQLGYENGEAAGTGIILTSTGRILTNNHVIDGATSIKVTVQSTGKSYTADVVGTNATQDVAVLQLQSASGLIAADLATTTASVGDAVTAVGNANGTGTLSAAAGTVSALGQTITTASEGSTAGETLHGLIEISADVVSGDSGGAVQDSDGDVIGVTTAASSGTSDVTGYAIPIATALGVAKQIVAGDDTSEITIGLPAFLGVTLTQDSSTGGAVIDSVLPGTAAAKTDLAAGDTITKVDGTSTASSSELSAAIAKHAVGDRVTITYSTSSGATHTTTVTLTAGPAD